MALPTRTHDQREPLTGTKHAVMICACCVIAGMFMMLNCLTGKWLSGTMCTVWQCYFIALMIRSRDVGFWLLEQDEIRRKGRT